MEFLRKYWPILFFTLGLISSAVLAQAQIATNSDDIEEGAREREKLEEKIDALESQKTEQAVMKANQENIKDDLKEIKDILRSFKQ